MLRDKATDRQIGALELASCLLVCICQLESKIIAKWNVTELVIYIGVQQRKNPPSRYCVLGIHAR